MIITRDNGGVDYGNDGKVAESCSNDVGDDDNAGGDKCKRKVDCEDRDDDDGGVMIIVIMIMVVLMMMLLLMLMMAMMLMVGIV